MHSERWERLQRIHTQLIKLSQAWAGKWGYDPDQARELRREAILLNHSHYPGHIPVYQKLAQRGGAATKSRGMACHAPTARMECCCNMA